MIINALADYYDRLAEDPEQDVAPFGFSREKISYCIVLKPDGSPVQIDDVRVTVETGGKSKKTRLDPVRLVVPDRGGRTGSSVKANFLWDNTGYALGCDGKGKPERSLMAFDAFRELHKHFLVELDDPGLAALCGFLEGWDPGAAQTRVAELGVTDWDDFLDKNIVFRVQGQNAYVHDSRRLRDAWLKQVMDETDSLPGFSLVSGREELLARLHPMIRGVAGAQSSGAAIVSFNLDAFESYQKSQSYNAPVGVGDAFRYTTALNRLVNDEHRRVRIAGDTIVFWTDKPTAFEDDFGPALVDHSADDEATAARLKGFWNRMKQARAGDMVENADVRFYVLCLSPNASRLSIRFWLVGTVQQFAERLGRHAEDLEITGEPPDSRPWTLQTILDQTARERKDVHKTLEGEVLRSVLSGGRYPQILLTSVLNRIRADSRVTHRRAAILKAYLIRNARDVGQKGENLVSLDRDHPCKSYHLGRLFAVLEKTQEEASDGKLNATIKDRFFSSASANPIAGFPRLLRLHAHHLEKIEHAGRRINLEKMVQEICGNLNGFPAHLPLEDQGLFFIGYYHQRQDFFTKKNDSDNGAAETEEK